MPDYGRVGTYFVKLQNGAIGKMSVSIKMNKRSRPFALFFVRPLIVPRQAMSRFDLFATAAFCAAGRYTVFAVDQKPYRKVGRWPASSVTSDLRITGLAHRR
jgi:hypothetical protein